MLKNLILLGLMTWVSFSYARPDYSVSRDTINEAEAYKVEKPVEEQEAGRAVAGAKIKKKKSAVKGDEPAKEEISETDSEVRYWQYSE